MINIKIPGQEEVQLKQVIFDVNGTLALDGELFPEVPKLLKELSQMVDIHLLTADTHGKQAEIDHQLGIKAVRVSAGNEAQQKATYLKNLGAAHTAAVGQGANDSLMLEAARIGICILSQEGTALETLLQADLIVPDIVSAISVLIHPTRLAASLRK
jgi:P-type E1-E2 ATPase